MDNKKICIISVYFGKLPTWIDIWLRSVELNEDIDFLLVTDDPKIKYSIKNLKIIYLNLNEFKRLAENKLKMKIKLENPYKLCDYKEIWGVILEDYISKYDYWGECDNDLVFGDLKYFFDKFDLSRYDKFGNRGHLSLYRNIAEVNDRYKLSGGWFGSYKEVFKSNLNWAFDETPGINAIYEKNNFSFMNKFIYADIDVNYKDIRCVERPGKLCKNYDQQIFYWSNGKVLRDYVDLSGKIKTDEFEYIHLQKRKMYKPKFDVFKTKEFYIINGQFIEKKGPTTIEIIDKYNKKNDIDVPSELFGGAYKKDMRFSWLGRRYLNFKFSIKQFLKK